MSPKPISGLDPVRNVTDTSRDSVTTDDARHSSSARDTVKPHSGSPIPDQPLPAASALLGGWAAASATADGATPAAAAGSFADIVAAVKRSLDSVHAAAAADATLPLAAPTAALAAQLSGNAAQAVPYLSALGDLLKNAYVINAEHPNLIDIPAATKAWAALYREVEPALARIDVTQDAAAAAAIQELKKVEARQYFGEVAREQWQYYAETVDASVSFLPPDNVKIGDDALEVDKRTSPTNIGLYMNSTMVAQKLGIIGLDEALSRLRDTVQTIKSLPKYTSTVRDVDGTEHPVEHLYNWYSLDGDPEEIGQGFISTVDNGNFAADVMGVITAIGDADQGLTRDLVDIVEKMRFDVLYDADVGLLYHGAYAAADGSLSFRAGDHALGHYDMVISEARSAYWAGIAKGELPESAWTNLKPKLNKEIDDLNVVEELDFQPYYGTMFEYLAHSSSMRLEGTPLGEADAQAVRAQAEDSVRVRADDDSVVEIWGRSESNSFTDEEYAAWGSPLLALSKQFTSTGRDVIAPYACQMAASLAPLEVAQNMRNMEAVGLRGRFGFMESCTVKQDASGVPGCDVTPQVYAHHNGWGFRGLGNYLLNGGVTAWLHDSRYNADKTLERLLRKPVEQYRQPLDKRAPAAAGPDDAYGAGPVGAYGEEFVHRAPPTRGAKMLAGTVDRLLRRFFPDTVDDAERAELTATIEKYQGRFHASDYPRLIRGTIAILRGRDAGDAAAAAVPAWISQGTPSPVATEEIVKQLGSSRLAAPEGVSPVREIIDLLKVEGILAGMSIEQKTQQMSTYTWSGAVTGPSGGSDADIQTTVSKGAGALFNVTTAEDANRLQEIAKKGGNEAPLLLGFDAISGFKTAGPIPLLQGCSFNPQVSMSVALVAAAEAYLHGNRQVFAPMVDDSESGPLWGRWVETYGAGSFLIGINAVMAAKGFKAGGLQTTAKHMLGYGYCNVDYGSADMNDRTIDELLEPYRLLIESGYLDWVMPGFNLVKGKPCTENKWLLQDVLRDQLGADVGIVSDYNAVIETTKYGTARDDRQAAIDSVLAGVQMCMEDGSFANYIPQAVKDGIIPESVVDAATRQILRLKAKAGLLDNDGRDALADPAKADAFCLSDTVRQVVYWAAAQSMVLLENKEGNSGEKVLPLAASAKKIAMIGPMTKDRDAPMGQWKADAKAEDTVSVWDAFENGLNPDQSLVYAKGCNVIGSDELKASGPDERKALVAEEEQMLAEAIAAAETADVVVVTLGTTRDMSGEARSRSVPNLPHAQIELVRRLKEKTDKPVVVVMETGLPVTGLEALQDSADAILWAGHGGSETGNAVRNILVGEENPSGHLSFDWSEHAADYPADRYDRLRTGRSQPDGIPVTNAYIAARKDAALDKDGQLTALDKLTPGRGVWVAGHGLSYTDFTVGELIVPKQLTIKELTQDGGVTVEVTVANTGKREGEEVVQLYMADLIASEVQPEKILAGFEKVKLAPGEKKTVTITIPTERFMSFSERQKKQVLETGDFKLWAAQDSRDESTEAVLRVVA